MKYSDQVANWLVELGYTHCFFVGGGNIMHLIESIDKKLICRPVINEVAAGIAAEYFNESSEDSKAFALVTAGPGLTNIVTAISGAYLESRELLVIGGQVKTDDLSRGKLRQRGIQEIDGISIVKSITKLAELIDKPISAKGFYGLVSTSWLGRKGPVFLEIPLDVQAAKVNEEKIGATSAVETLLTASNLQLEKVVEKFNKSLRPVLLLGGGISRRTTKLLQHKIAALGCPVMTTYNAADRIPSDQPNYAGRPNTWGQRSSNIIVQQSDFLLAVGTRLGLQQTGFNWQGFIPNGIIAQVDIDQAELEKGHPNIGIPVCGDANDFLKRFFDRPIESKTEWLDFAKYVRSNLSQVELVNKTGDNFISPYVFLTKISALCVEKDIIIPCSSGGAFTASLQTIAQKKDQIVITNKSLASMGYGLSGSIGAAFANPDKRVVLFEGDGGFSQNMQEIGTAAINRLNLKIFIFDDSGHASIRMTQRSYFGGNYVGCDIQTGLGMPNWEKLFCAWDVPVMKLKPEFDSEDVFTEAFNTKGIHAFIVPIDPEQTYFPKIMSRLTEKGTMESNPLHLMSPDLSDEQTKNFFRYF